MDSLRRLQRIEHSWQFAIGRDRQPRTATLVARVALSIIIFAIEKDRLYAAITVTVLLLLFASFVLGAAG